MTSRSIPSAAADPPSPAPTWLVIVALLLLGGSFKLSHTINHDVTWYLHSAGALLDGGRAYVDVFVDPNPPLMLYLSVPGVALARWTGWSPPPAFVLTVLAAIVWSLWLSGRVLPGLTASERRGVLVLAALAVTILPATDFGQRSHVMVCLALPYLLLAAARWPPLAARPCGPVLAAVIGGWAGLGFAIKPHYLMVPAALALASLWRRRRIGVLFRPEIVALGAVVLAYGVAIVVVTPDYLTRIVPLALEVYDGAYRNPLSMVLSRPETVLLPLAIAAHFCLRKQLTAPLAALGDVFLVAGVTLFAVYLVQMKGWNYHVYPTTAVLVMLAAALTAHPIANARMVRNLMLAVVVLLLAKATLFADNRYRLMDQLLPHVVRNTEPGDALYLFSSNTWTGFPLAVYAGREWASRFPALWMLPALAAAADQPGLDSERTAAIERYAVDALITDLTTRRPAIVIVDARAQKPWYGPAGFDFIAFFARDPRFRAFWAGYEQIGVAASFEIYRRHDPP